MGAWPGLLGESAFWLGLVAGAVLTAGIALHRRRQRARGRLAAALLSGEVYNAAIVEAAPDAMVATDMRGHIEWANRASASIFGLPPQELRGRELARLLPAVGAQGIGPWLDRHGIAGRVIGLDTEGLRVDGTAFPCAVSASVCDAGGQGRYIFIVRDTTDSKWAEQELLLRERALESAADGITIASMELPGEPVIYANAAFRRMTGCELDEVIGRPSGFLQPDEAQQSALDEVRSAIRERRSTRVVLRQRRSDGSSFWNELRLSPVVREDGRVTHFVSVQTDITERLAYEEMLQLRTERLHTIFDLSPDGFVALDEHGYVTVVNPAFERMTGLRAATLIGQPEGCLGDSLAQITRGTEQADSMGSAAETQPCADAGAIGQATFRGELLHLAVPSPRTLLRRVRHSRGDGHETVMYFRDITRELEVDRMKSEFLSMAAHELRTPMASIYGFAELLLRREFDEVRRRDMLVTIHRQAGVLINLVNELLDLARIEARRGKDFRRRAQPLAPIIESTLAGILVHGDARKVLATLPSEPVHVLVDESKLSMALTNVISNAYKYSAAETDIMLGLRRGEIDGHAAVGICVRDQGIGMTPDQLGRLFERFFRADTSGNIPGTGLGMTIVKEVVELMDGRVDVSSDFGVGTTVTLWFPMVRSDAAVGPTPAPAPAPARLGT